MYTEVKRVLFLTCPLRGSLSLTNATFDKRPWIELCLCFLPLFSRLSLSPCQVPSADPAPASALAPSLAPA